MAGCRARSSPGFRARHAGRFTRAKDWFRSIPTSGRRRRPRSRSPSAATSRAGCTAPTSRSPRSTRATATASRSRSARSRASGGATSGPPRPGGGGEIGAREGSGIGGCDTAPAATVEERPVRAADVPEVVQQALDGDEPPARAKTPPRTWPNDPYAEDPDLPRYAVVRRLITGQLGGEESIEVLEESELVGMGSVLEHAVGTIRGSGLRGMGGAGFPTGSKWETVAAQDGGIRYVICNADESEPGTFKDRQILAEQPHLVIEGMLAGMIAIGAEQGW